MGTMNWQPAWWNDAHASTWDRVKEAIRRDWQQTKHDVGMKGGHELNQSLADTTKQAAGKEPIPAIDRANPPKVIGDWNEVEIPIEYGYSARAHYQMHAAWTDELESKLRSEWTARKFGTARAWEDVREHVKFGFEHKH
jgi:hypothetical protein